MEKSYFFQDDILEVLNKHYVEARLHTDKGTDAQKERMRELQTQLVSNRGMPTFVVVDPATGKRISGEQSFSPDPNVILDFLKANVQN